MLGIERLLAVGLASAALLAIAGCGDADLRRLGSISVGDPMPEGDPPPVRGRYVRDWLCGGRLASAANYRRPPECHGLSTYTVIYEDDHWAYAVEVVDHRVQRIRRQSRQTYP